MCFHNILTSAGLHIQIKHASSAIFFQQTIWNDLSFSGGLTQPYDIMYFSFFISKYEWTFIYHIFLLQARGPGFSVRKPRSVFTCRGLSRLHGSVFYKRSKSIWWKASSAKGGWPPISVQDLRVMKQLQRSQTTCTDTWHLHLHFFMEFQAVWSVFVQVPAQGTLKRRGWFGSPPVHFLILAQSKVYLWLLSPVPTDQASASWKHK